jgi:uroporphyrinogen-III synthase
MREIPLQNNLPAFVFMDRLLAGDFDMVIFLTGVGAKLLMQAIETRHPPGLFQEALREIAVVVRGPKPSGVMREWQVPVAAIAPEPNTWREVLSATEGRPERSIAVQEFGRSSVELLAGLRARGAEVTSVPVYQWELPEDTGPLREAVHRLACGEFDLVLFTAVVQLTHLLQIAEAESVDLTPALRKTMIASIGPTTSEALREQGIPPDFEPSHPKMGILVSEALQQAPGILQLKGE